MDRNSWTCEVMAMELHREGKIAEASLRGNQMADPRQYLYLEAASDQRGTVVSFAIKLKGNPSWYSSDLGISYHKIERSGYFRTTLRLPPGTKLDLIERIAVRCDGAGNPKSGEGIEKLVNAGCDLKAVNKAFMLDEHFQPGPSLPVRFSNQQFKLRFGEMVELYGAGRTHKGHIRTKCKATLKFAFTNGRF